jgi:hypothetical protein
MKKFFTLLVMALMAVGANAQDTWTVAGTQPLVDKSWDPSDATADGTKTPKFFWVSDLLCIFAQLFVTTVLSENNLTAADLDGFFGIW